MSHFFSINVRQLLSRTLVVGLCAWVGSACSTLHESDLAANRSYNEFGSSGYKPSLAGKAKSAPGAAKAFTKTTNRKVQYSPMVERTATGVRVVKDFTSQARTKTNKASAEQVRASRAQQNARVSKSSNNENLLNR